MLGSHGLFTWGDTAYESYVNTLEVVERCAEYMPSIPKGEKKRATFGGQKIQSLNERREAKESSSINANIKGLLFQ